VVAAFATEMMHTLTVTASHFLAKHGTVATITHSAHVMGNRFLIKAVVGAVIPFIVAHLGGGGAAKSVAALAGPIVLGVVLAFAAANVITFSEDLAREIAPKIRDALDGDNFREQNKSTLEKMFEDTVNDWGWQFTKAMGLEIDVGEKAKEALDVFVKTKEQAGIEYLKSLRHGL
jgi:hypothetical protein